MKSHEDTHRVAEDDLEAIQKELTYLRLRLETVIDQNFQLRNAGDSNFSSKPRFDNLTAKNYELEKKISEIESSEIWRILKFITNLLNALRLNSIVKKIGIRVYRFLLIKRQSKAKS